MLKILYVEDNEVNRDMLSRRLRLEGFEVLLAGDGQQGVSMAKDEKPDLILMDLSLPVLDGWEATRLLKADPETRGIPVIALTAHAMAGDREKSLKAGCDDYDTKPVNMETLLSKMRSQLGIEANDSPEAQRPQPPKTEKKESDKGRILVVDDNETNRDFLSRRLEMEGFSVELAEDGRRALETLKRRIVDLVLLDVMMPGISGYEVLEEIRLKQSLTELPVIMVTARDRSEDIVQALKLGANDYITKPIDIRVLLARVQAHIRVAQLEEALRSEKEFSDSLIQSAYEMIVSVDTERRITLFNQAAEKAFGYRREEVLGKSVDILYAKSEDGRSVHETTLRENGFWGEVLNRSKDGREFYSSLSASILRDKNGEPIGLMGISLDVTEQKKIQEERERMARLKDEFLQIASHDLKNPLTVISSAGSILEDVVPPGATMSEEAYGIVTRICRSAALMERIIVDFLDFQALEDGQIKLQRESTDLNQRVRRMIESLADYAEGKKIRVASDLADSLPQVSIDSARVDQVIQNFVGNAIKFSPEGSLVTVYTRQDSGSILLEVEDHGPGLSDEDMKKLFVKYARLSNVPTGGEKSSGLGLAICKRLIELHQGEIGARNNPERGSTFWFRLPRE